MADKQKTIKSPSSVSGAGLHTGQTVTLTFKPAPVNHGIKFCRTDIEGSPIVEADADLVVDTSRGTTIEKNGVRISTIEHTLAAVIGMDIDNVLIELDCVETPILDGSSRFYVEAIQKAGVVEQDADRVYFELKSNIDYIDQERRVEMLIVPDKEFRVSVMIDYETQVLGTEYASIDKLQSFANDVADCRTFVFLHELEYLIQNDLIKGGDLSNAIVFVDRIVSQDELDRLAKYFGKPKIQVLKEGMLNNVELRYPNEPARHKLLDVIGDLALIGMRIKGHVIATRPGHLANTNFARLIKQHIRNSQSTDHAPIVDVNKTPIYDINDIKKILPHRPPFLFVDKILEISDHHVIGLKNVTMNEGFFVGHFPDEPVMPGVLQVEAMAQTGGIFVLSTVPDPENYITYFLKMENVRFRHKVVPGDTLIFVLELISPFRRGICHMKGIAYVGNKIVSEAELMAQIAKKTTK
ncbi:MAG: bifunctional UDP-3-O-[3-hydroxymyristoyl] N-acetylglucosamine deacetylase/3-hydroxyacyl-ACP dehydratase [Bacteroidales bacterium]